MQFAGSLWNHTPAMMEKVRTQQLTWESLSPEEMGKLSAYLFYVKFLGQPGDATRGRVQFEERLCAKCHQLEGRGGTTGPRLDELKDYVSSFFLARALWDHGPEMVAKMDELKLERPRLEANDVGDLVALIRGDAQPTAPPELVYAGAGSPRAGMAVFRDKKCASCHAIKGSGGTAGPDLGETAATRRVGEIAGALWNHGPKMWAKMKQEGVTFPRLSDREMADLMAYLYFVQYTDRGGDPTRGEALFRAKSCVQCHSAGDHGATVGPDLAASGIAGSTQEWASAMWNHAPAMNEKVREKQTEWPQFADDEMRDLVEFLRARAGRVGVSP
jgi:cytochrome c2